MVKWQTNTKVKNFGKKVHCNNIYEKVSVNMTCLEVASSFDSVSDALEGNNTIKSVAEIHGLLCGVICAGQRMDCKSWVEPTLGTILSKR